MKQLKLNLENCYGIRSLRATLDYSAKSSYSIYAPNGTMKSSLALTFADVVGAQNSTDRIFPDRVTKRSIADESDQQVLGASVLVVQPYDDAFESEKTATLLVNADLRREYEAIHASINLAKEALLDALKKQSKSKRDLEAEMIHVFGREGGSFLDTMSRVQAAMSVTSSDTTLADVEYDKLFDESVVSVLETKDFKKAIESYIKEYNKLLSKSAFFGKSAFNYWDGGEVSKNLHSHGFFKIGHHLLLRSPDGERELDSSEQLNALIAQEKESISADPAVREKFSEIERALKKNITARNFEAYLSDHEEILPLLADIDEAKKAVLTSYLWAHYELLNRLVKVEYDSRKRLLSIEAQARRERTEWEAVIDIFNQRFFVPFQLEIKNKVSVVVGEHEVPSIDFVFQDGADQASVDRDALVRVLSQGERKALYILNIIFEVQGRRKAKQDTLLVFDDIADSFDYKNKYAIVQYLRDIDETPGFKLLILTHNFDFFRTLALRFVGQKQSLMAKKTSKGVQLEKAEGIRNIFVDDWKPHFSDQPLKRIACIPFMRNLVEYTKGSKDPAFVSLTALLHWKTGTTKITQSELDSIFSALFGLGTAYKDPNERVVDFIATEAKTCLSAGESINFENKIVLAIATRLIAEKYMISKINDPSFLAGITHNQTPRLVKKYETSYPNESETLRVLRRVELMTPENIHLNSFMFEPILDMSDDHLKQLYQDAKALK